MDIRTNKQTDKRTERGEGLSGRVRASQDMAGRRAEMRVMYDVYRSESLMDFHLLQAEP